MKNFSLSNRALLVSLLALVAACEKTPVVNSIVSPTQPEAINAPVANSGIVDVSNQEPAPAPGPVVQGLPTRETLLALREMPKHIVKTDFEPGHLAALCDLALAEAKASIETMLRHDAIDFGSTVLSFETTLALLGEDTNRLQFLSEVSTNEAQREEAFACSAKGSEFYVNLFTRRDVYEKIKATPSEGLNAAQKKLLEEYIEGFESNGLKLDDARLAQLNAKLQAVALEEQAFQENLNADKTEVALTVEELEGVPASILDGFPRDAQGVYHVPMKAVFYSQIVQNAVRSETRKKAALAYQTRAADKNLAVLKRVLALRREIAAMLGFSTWADFKLSTGRMAKDVPTVMNFLQGLKTRLAPGLAKDYAKLLAFKRELDPSATKIEPWDLSFLEYQLQKRDFSLDTERIREYFPSDYVVKAMFQVYSQLLGVRYEEVEGAPVWADGVKLYRVLDAKSGALLAHFYTDFFPREGKYGHAAAFSLTPGRQLRDGQYNIPMASIVANFAPPSGGKPSLLTHDDVSTVFHEFGHIMHQVLTRVPYASLSGTSVARDFVEAPSQMLENWVWEPEVLASLSSHYLRPDERLPKTLIDQMIAARDFMQSRATTTQLYYGLMDMTFHTMTGDFDTTAVQHALYRDVMKLEPIAGSHFEASFGHLMGYDAGYYGYLWSDVFAADMFTRFQKEGVLNPATGGDYRRIILEKGGLLEPIDLVRDFLGREPSDQAFLRRLGIASGN